VPVVEEYWEGVLKRLQAEVDVFSRLVAHQGERGRENELAFARLLEALVPQRYGVGSGLLIDSQDQYSKQMDIVVYDAADEPTVLAQATQLLFPVEQVRACLEVKTTLTSREIRDCGAKRKSISALTSTGRVPPVFVVLAYAADTSPSAVAKNFSLLPAGERPDLVCVLDPGLLLGTKKLLGYKGSTFAAGLTLLHQRDEVGARVPGVYQRPGSGEHDGATVQGVVYPITEDSKGASSIAEPARALLLFCEALLRLLAERHGSPTPWLSHYLRAQTRELEWL
jgi:hypothetical protein